MKTTSEQQDKKKLYYTIGEVAQMFHVEVSNIRFWENEFDILTAKRNNKGNRLFSPKDVENIRLIHHLLKERGLTIKGAKQKLKDNKADIDHNYEIVKKLKGIKALLLEIKEEM